MEEGDDPCTHHGVESELAELSNNDLQRLGYGSLKTFYRQSLSALSAQAVGYT